MGRLARDHSWITYQSPAQEADNMTRKRFTDEEIEAHRKEYNKKYRLEHKEEILAKQGVYYASHRERRKEYGKKYYLEHPEYEKERSKKYHLEHKDAEKKYLLEHQEERKEYITKYRLENWDKIKERNRQYNREHQEEQREFRATQRKDVIERYGGKPPKCACCGETIYEFLCIDHVNNDGAKHRKEIGGHSRTNEWLIKHNYPDGFQVLCYNCNMAKWLCGECPHKRLMNV